MKCLLLHVVCDFSEKQHNLSMRQETKMINTNNKKEFMLFS